MCSDNKQNYEMCENRFHTDAVKITIIAYQQPDLLWSRCPSNLQCWSTKGKYHHPTQK